MFQASNNRMMVRAAPADRSGAAASMLATAGLIGQTAGAVGVALLFRLAGVESRWPLLTAGPLSAVAAAISFRRGTV